MRVLAWLAVLPLVVPLAAVTCGAATAASDCCKAGCGGCSCPPAPTLNCCQVPAILEAVAPDAPSAPILLSEAPGAHEGVVPRPAATPVRVVDANRIGNRHIFLLDCALLC